MGELLNLEMKLISHRANIFGPNPLLENHPDQIDKCIKLGYDVEVDMRMIDSIFYLGHDSPDYCVSMEWINDRENNLWIHCKDFMVLNKFSFGNNQYNYFWHQEDNFTLTSKGYIWTYPYKQVTNMSVICLQQEQDTIPKGCYGICSDWVSKYENTFLSKP